MVRAVLFDLDQTLVNFPSADAGELFRAGASRCYAFLSAHQRSLPPFSTFCRRQRWNQRKIDWITRLTGGEPDQRGLLRRLCRDYGLQRDQASLAMLGWLWYEPIADHAAVAPDIRPTLAALTQAGVELGLVVNSPYQGAVIDQHLENLGLLEFFPTRAYSTEIGARKPDARLFMAALESMGVLASEAIFVGDDIKADMLGARRVGMTTVLRQSGSSTLPVPTADHVIRQISELLDLPQLAHVRARPRPISPAIPELIVKTA